jgi:hypothetical protein
VKVEYNEQGARVMTVDLVRNGKPVKVEVAAVTPTSMESSLGEAQLELLALLVEELNAIRNALGSK